MPARLCYRVRTMRLTGILLAAALALAACQSAPPSGSAALDAPGRAAEHTTPPENTYSDATEDREDVTAGDVALGFRVGLLWLSLFTSYLDAQDPDDAARFADDLADALD